MKNHEARPTGTAQFPEMNVARHNHYGKNHGCGHTEGRDIGFVHIRNDNNKNTSFY